MGGGGGGSFEQSPRAHRRDAIADRLTGLDAFEPKGVELCARKVFNDTQAEESGEGSVDAGGGADQMIYMEYLEALGAIACYKYPNPYIPLHIKLEQFFTDSFYGLFPNLVGKALPKPRKSAKKGAKAVGAAARAKKKK